jgi:hypothetical protein
MNNIKLVSLSKKETITLKIKESFNKIILLKFDSNINRENPLVESFRKARELYFLTKIELGH